MKAILVDKADDRYTAQITHISTADLPAGDVTVGVEYSTLNYKDSLAITGASPVVRRFPMVPGIDFAGTVVDSESEEFAVGDRVLLNGWGVGETHWGGYAEVARVKSDWLIPMPSAFTTRQAMAIGTAGYTAMLCVLALEDHGASPMSGPVVVTGATGGVGSVAVAVLAMLGYDVIAVTGKAEEHDYLSRLGASEIIDRAELSEPGRPLGKERWAGAIDSVGSHTLANVLASTKYGGTVAACGLARGMDLPATVLPFILRSVTLAGVDSVHCSRPRRMEAWARLAADLDVDLLDEMSTEAPLEDVFALAKRQLEGGIKGRTIVKVKS